MSAIEKTHGEVLLDLIYDEVDQQLNPSGEDCWHCGGEGVTHDCFVECKIFAGQRAKAVREEVIKSGDIDIAREWLVRVGRWHPGITDDQIKAQLTKAATPPESPHGR